MILGPALTSFWLMGADSQERDRHSNEIVSYALSILEFTLLCRMLLTVYLNWNQLRYSVVKTTRFTVSI